MNKNQKALIKGQPHRLAWINPVEENLLRRRNVTLGGEPSVKGPKGIPAYPAPGDGANNETGREGFGDTSSSRSNEGRGGRAGGVGGAGVGGGFGGGSDRGSDRGPGGNSGGGADRSPGDGRTGASPGASRGGADRSGGSDRGMQGGGRAGGVGTAGVGGGFGGGVGQGGGYGGTQGPGGMAADAPSARGGQSPAGPAGNYGGGRPGDNPGARAGIGLSPDRGVQAAASRGVTGNMPDIDAATQAVSQAPMDSFGRTTASAMDKLVNERLTSMAMSPTTPATITDNPFTSIAKTPAGFARPGTKMDARIGEPGAYAPSSSTGVDPGDLAGFGVAQSVASALSPQSATAAPSIDRALSPDIDAVEAMTNSIAGFGARNALAPAAPPATRGVVAMASEIPAPTPPNPNPVQFGFDEGDLTTAVPNDPMFAGVASAIASRPELLNSIGRIGAHRNAEAAMQAANAQRAADLATDRHVAANTVERATPVSAPPASLDPGPPAQFDSFAPTISRVAEMSADPTLGALVGAYSGMKAGMANVRNNADPQGMTGGDGGVRYQTAAAMQPPATPTPPPMPDDWWQRWRSRWGYEGLLGNPRDVINEGLI